MTFEVRVLWGQRGVGPGPWTIGVASLAARAFEPASYFYLPRELSTILQVARHSLQGSGVCSIRLGLRRHTAGERGTKLYFLEPGSHVSCLCLVLSGQTSWFYTTGLLTSHDSSSLSSNPNLRTMVANLAYLLSCVHDTSSHACLERRLWIGMGIVWGPFRYKGFQYRSTRSIV